MITASKMELKERIDAFAALGKRMEEIITHGDESYHALCSQAYHKNNWYTKENIDHAMLAWTKIGRAHV